MAVDTGVQGALNLRKIIIVKKPGASPFTKDEKF
jgi:hypothetical protein